MIDREYGLDETDKVSLGLKTDAMTIYKTKGDRLREIAQRSFNATREPLHSIINLNQIEKLKQAAIKMDKNILYLISKQSHD